MPEDCPTVNDFPSGIKAGRHAWKGSVKGRLEMSYLIVAVSVI